jgi:putative addiction module killer protein
MVILEYVDSAGSSPFSKWFQGLDAHAAAKVTTALTRLSLGNVSNTKSLSGGVMELRIDFGPGYRVYFGRDGETIVILLGGGTKRRQDADIAAARERWRDYKQRKG